MTQRLLSIGVLLGIALFAASCSNKHVQNPIANVNSKQPDKVLFDRAMDAMKHNRYDVARITLQTLINTYPDSEYVARAKLAVGDSWYAEGGSAGLAQAEIEYKDFITFFPNMAEAAEAQLKVANIHYRQMEKPDRDFTHAKRAEEEYRQLILQFPDSKLVPEAKQRLLEVQEVLAEREYRIGRFYYLRESWPAAIARLKSLTDTYPLYSQVDDALYMLGDSYEREVERVRALKITNQFTEAMKGKMIKDLEDRAAEAYGRIITRYPVMGRAADAKRRLQALHRPVPTPTAAAVAQNKAEEQGRATTGRIGRVMLNLHRRPDVAQATKAGEPTLVDPKQTSATEVAQQMSNSIAARGAGNNTVSVETTGTGTPAANQSAPRSDATAQTTTNAQPAVGDSSPTMSGGAAAATAGTPANMPAGSDNQIPELRPNLDSSAGTPSPENGGSTAPLPPPAQINDAVTSPAGNPSEANTSSSSGDNVQTSSNNNSQTQSQDQNGSSSSKKKKKKKFIAF